MDDELLLGEDGYDAEEIFGDDTRPAVSRDAAVHAVREVVRQAQKWRIPPPPVTVTPTVGEVGEACGDEMMAEILGAMSRSRSFTPVDSPAYPVTQNLYQRFRAAMPAAKVVRLDTADSFRQFMKRASGERIPLSLPPWAEGKVACWQDGSEIFCAMRVPGPDGQPRVVTSSTPVSRHVETVLGYASDANVDPVEVMGVLPALAQVLGGGSLVTQLAQATPGLLEKSGGAPFVGKVAPLGDPSIAAGIALLQLCERGNERACAEAERLRATSRGREMLSIAAERLKRAQAKKKGAL